MKEESTTVTLVSEAWMPPATASVAGLISDELAVVDVESRSVPYPDILRPRWPDSR